MADKDLQTEYSIEKIKKQLKNTNDNIEENIKLANNGVAVQLIAQNILKDLRTLVEMLMCIIYMKKRGVITLQTAPYSVIKDAIADVNNSPEKDYYFLKQFHDELQIVVSHYMPSKTDSARLMLKYIDYLYKIKDFSKNQLQINLLNNLQNFVVFNDKSKSAYYSKIAKRIISIQKAEKRTAIKSEQYYIWSIKPFLWNRNRFYEVTYVPARDNNSKLDRLIAFTLIPIFPNYAVKLNFRKDSITDNGVTIPIRVITGYKTSIRRCEFQNFYKAVFGPKKSEKNTISTKEINIFNSYITYSRRSLSSLVTTSDNDFNQIMKVIINELENTKPIFVNCLYRIRRLIQNGEAGKNTLLYLLYHMNNKIIKLQITSDESHFESNYLTTRCYPFEKMPYMNSLIRHNPRLMDIVHCGIDLSNHEEELFARKIRNNVEKRRMLFTPVEDFKDIDYKELITRYNSKLWDKARDREKLVYDKGKIFINGYVEDLKFIYKKINILSQNGFRNYKLSMREWIDNHTTEQISDEKEKILTNIFDKSKVAFLYGAAGTGKTTLIKYLSEYLNYHQLSAVYLAQTNTALNNLKKKVNGKENFYTITNFLNNEINNINTNILVIDECSTVSNHDICTILEKANYQAVLLVGDSFQIPSIKFGNWFTLCKEYFNKRVVHELKKVYRTSDDILQKTWDEVRHASVQPNNIKEFLIANGVSKELNGDLLNYSNKDSIILCLNYDGLYGINNINSYLQEKNKNPAITFDSGTYKINDPIVFNETNRFYPAIYNNMKGRIINVFLPNLNTITFDIELNTVISEIDAFDKTFKLLGNTKDGKSVIRFSVLKSSSDDDAVRDEEYTMPFNVTYAMSVHKAQGLEFDEVKLVVDGNREENLDINTFYTAITRAKKKLNIFWTPETENDFLKSIQTRKDNSEMRFLYNCYLR